jgi:formamidopyrimidine-DNA glycosylase
MPELPEVTCYLEAFRREIVGVTLRGVRIRSPSLLRTWDPPVSEATGREVTDVSRIGKRIVWSLEGDLHLVVHLMVTGRFHRKAAGQALPRRRTHAAFDFDHASYFLTEAGKEKKARLHLVRGASGLAELDPGGLESLEITTEEFADALRRENRTLKRALTDPRILSGIGNAHSDEILLRARLSPVQRTGNLSDDEMARLHVVARDTLAGWVDRLREETGDSFPEKITAFHPAMAAHGKFGEPCPQCGDPIQRIAYAGRETNYCATCQTGGKLLADRALSRLLKGECPRTLEELEDLRASHRSSGDHSPPPSDPPAVPSTGPSSSSSSG